MPGPRSSLSQIRLPRPPLKVRPHWRSPQRWWWCGRNQFFAIVPWKV